MSRPRTPNAARPAHLVAGALYTAVVVALAAIAAWPVYASWSFLVLVAAATGTAALIVAIVSWRRWGGGALTACTVGAFVLLCVPVAVPSRLGDPSDILRGVGEAFAGVVVAWKDLVTVDLPVGAYRNLLVPALVVFLVGTVLTLSLAWRPDRRTSAAVVSGSLMIGFGLFFGRTSVSSPFVWGPLSLPAPVETGVGLGSVLAAVLWLAWRAHDERTRSLRRVGAVAPVQPRRRRSGTDHRRTAVGAGMVLIAVVATLAVVPATAADADRRVLRSGTGPERQLAEAVSPLSQYRAMFSDARADDVLFRVDGGDSLPDRIRVATLDDYDGEIFRSSGVGEGRFVRVPSRLGVAQGRPIDVQIEIDDLGGIWMPTAGRLDQATFSGARQDMLADRFYYSAGAEAGVQIADGGLAPGDRYRLTASEPAAPDVSFLAAPGAPAGVTGGENLRRWVDEHASGDGGAALTSLVQLLRERGYLSHGLAPSAGASTPTWASDLPGYHLQPSASGHSMARIEAMFQRLLDREEDPRAAASGNFVAAVGDDEQFAVATALIARELGFPSRVVVGTRLSSADPNLPTCEAGVCRARDLSAWTEVQGADGSWVAIDVTPQWERSPSLEVTEQRDPENVTEVRPDTVDDVVPPDPLQEDNALDDEDRSVGGPDLSWLWPVLRVVGISLLAVIVLFGPFLAVIVAKALRRRSRRRDPDPRAAIAGGWDEYVDAGVDTGHELPPSSTRRELAAALGTGAGLRLADDADRAVFSSTAVTADEAAAFWRTVDTERRALARQRGGWRRLRAALSLRSFLRFLAPRPMRRRPPHRDERGTRPTAPRRRDTT